jgi:hypothetical protein
MTIPADTPIEISAQGDTSLAMGVTLLKTE